MAQKHAFTHSLQLEWQWLKSSRWDMAMVTWVPLLSLLLIWWIFSPIVPYKLPIAVLDQDHSSVSRQITRYIDASPLLKVKAQYSDNQAAQDALQQNEVFAVVVLPAKLSNQLKSGHPSTVIAHVNSQYGTHSKLIQSNLQQVIGTVSAGVQIKLRMAGGATAQQAHGNFAPVSTRLVPLFNISSDYQLFLGTAMMPALLHILAMTAGAYAVGRELRDKTIENWLQNTHEQSVGLMHLLASLLGKLLPVVLAFVLLNAFMLYLIQKTHFVSISSWLVTYFSACALSILSIVLGAFLSLLTLSLRTALSGTGVLTAPAFAFSGVGFPLLAMTKGAFIWAMILPYTHYGVLQVRQMQMGAPASYALPTLFGYGLAIMIFMGLNVLALKRAFHLPTRWGAR